MQRWLLSNLELSAIEDLGPDDWNEPLEVWFEAVLLDFQCSVPFLTMMRTLRSMHSPPAPAL
jgi:hypothetical protein